jgi:hypothetical protein
MSRIFAIPNEGVVYEELGVAPPHDYVDALGEPIDPARFDSRIVIWSSEEV